MKFDSFNAVLLAIAFLMPGFVWSAIYASLVPRKSESEQVRFLEFLTLSSINNAFWSWLLFIAYRKRWWESHVVLSALVILTVLFVSPTVAAVVTAKFKQEGWSARFSDWLGFRTALRETTAWDYKFSETDDPVWVLVRLKGGEIVKGFFGADSFAGDAGPTADLYLERTLRPGEKGTDKTSKSSVWIASDQIATIEFVGEQ